jgi:hypothetical protein
MPRHSRFSAALAGLGAALGYAPWVLGDAGLGADETPDTLGAVWNLSPAVIARAFGEGAVVRIYASRSGDTGHFGLWRVQGRTIVYTGDPGVPGLPRVTRDAGLSWGTAQPGWKITSAENIATGRKLYRRHR